MKLRLEDNTLRLRLSPEEVTEFARAGRLQTVVPLGPAAPDALIYVVERTSEPGALELRLAYTPGRIVVHLPGSVSDEWTSTEAVSLRGTFPVHDNQVLHILVEKDLGCKH